MNTMATVNPFKEIVPASVSGSAPSTNYYDVFINHRGPDVRLTLATHIRDKLSAAGITVFLDVDSLQLGDAFPAKIEQAIRSASVHLAIFSIRYAESPWCLSELAFMLQTGKRVIPVFYHVQPSDVRWVREDKGVYAAAFSHYKDKGRYSPKKLEEWMVALENASFLKGIEVRNDTEEEMLNNIVNMVRKILPKAPLLVAREPVGLDDIVLDFERKTAAPAQNVQIVGIVGMGGAGKTTLAKELFNRKSSSYQRSSFVFEVRDAASRKTLQEKQKKLLEDLGFQGPTFDSIEEGKATLATRLRSVHALIVLDDVEDENQLDALLPGQDCLALDSFVIVTTREKNLLAKWPGSHIYMIKEFKHSRELFCRHAFLQSHPEEGFEDIVEQFLKACNGLPLSLEVFGGLVYKKCKDYWKSQLEKISRIQPKDITRKLKVSYDSLDEEQKEMFMDVACFFIGEKSSLAIEVWNGSKWSGLQGWETLVNKCLIALDGNSNITMHDHLRDLGRDLAGTHPITSRLWLPDQMMNIQKLIAVGRSIRGIYAAQFGYTGEAFCRGRRLKKKFESTGTSNGLRLLTDSGDRFIKYFSTSLEEPVLLNLNKFKGRKLPSSWSLKDLRILELTDAHRLRQLWDDSDPPLELRNLRIVQATELQRIPKSIERLKELKRIVLRNCQALKNLPEEFSGLRSLEWLDLSRCSLLSSLPSRFGDLISLQHIDLSRCRRLQGLPDSFKQLRHLQHLNVDRCRELTFRSDMLESISNLEYFNLNLCEKVELLPDQITNQVFLRELYLLWTGIRELPSDIGELRKLEVLEIGSPLLASLPNSLGNLSSLPNSLGNLSSLTRLWIDTPSLTSLPSSFYNLSRLAELYLSNSKLNSFPDIVVGSLPMITKTAVSTIPIIRDSCPSLETLELWSNNHLMEIQSLPTSLRTLKVSGSKMLKKIMGLRGLTNLQSLEIRNCPELRELASFADLHSLQTVYIKDCDKVVKIEGLENCRSLERLEVESCWTSQVIQSLEGMEKLKRLVMVVENRSALRPCFQNINIEASPYEMWICGRAVSGAESVMDSLSLSHSFPTLTVLSSLENESKDFWWIKCGKINASQVRLCCFLVDSPEYTEITLSVGSFHWQDMRLREGKRVIVSVLRSGSWDSTESVYERAVRIECGRGGVKRVVVVVGEKGRVLEAFPHFLPLFI